MHMAFVIFIRFYACWFNAGELCVFLPALGQNKVFHVKEYLTPKDLSEKGLAPSLDAMEVRDFTVPNSVTKKRLLRILWRDIPFEARFGKYIQKRGFAFSFFKNCYI